MAGCNCRVLATGREGILAVKRKQYIFRWKEDGIEVIPSKAGTPEEVWEFAERNLYPAQISRAEGKRIVHRFGEVVECEGA